MFCAFRPVKGVVIALLAGMVFLVIAEALVPSGSLPGPVTPSAVRPAWYRVRATLCGDWAVLNRSGQRQSHRSGIGIVFPLTYADGSNVVCEAWPELLAGGRCLAVVKSWCSVEELVQWGFAQAPVVMANEAHNGLARCGRTREVGVRMIRAAHEAGVRRLAMEALPWPSGEAPGPIQAMPTDQGGYLAQPDMRRLIDTALDRGWSLWAYEAQVKPTADTDPAEFLTMQFTNWREREQARNLCRVLAAAPAEPLLVWCGNGHASKEKHEWVPMGWHFRAMSGTDPFVIDQTVSITFEGQPHPWVQALLASLGETLAAHGGTAGILREQAPAPLNCRADVDALVISTENTLS